jgi:hypothetical protein
MHLRVALAVLVLGRTRCVDDGRVDDGSGRDLDAAAPQLSGQGYLANYGLPQILFHVTTAYAILRHNGLAIGKRDYMGAY